MTGGRQPGRPKKPMPASTLGPAPMRGAVLKEQSQFSEMLVSIDAAEAGLIGTVRKKRPTLTNVHALGLALEDELSKTERQNLLQEDAELRSKEKRYVKKGGNSVGGVRTQLKANRIEEVGKNTRDLLAKIRPNGPFSIFQAAEKLLNNWDNLGDGGAIPSLTTARRWLKELSTSS